jgi:signal transduction histidine kinase
VLVHAAKRRRAPTRFPASLISLRNRIALLFFVITFVAIATLYIYIAPGLQTRLIDGKLSDLASSAQRYTHAQSHKLARSATELRQSQNPAHSATELRTLERAVDSLSLQSGARVTLLSVAVGPAGPTFRTLADSTRPTAARTLGFPAAHEAARTGQTAAATESTMSGSFAEAATPISVAKRVALVAVYSAPISDILRNVATVRHEIVVAGGIALAMALIGGLLTARWLGRRVKRLELAAERVAAGDFEQPITVDSRDELGQLAMAFNDMQQQLAQLESARKKFIATASHELRTPIFSLGGFVELLEDDDLDAETRRRFLDQISEQVERLSKLSVDLLDLSRLESGSLELRPEQVDLGELTRSVSAEFEPSLAHHDSQIELHLGSQLDANCDPVRVAQIVRILIDNAVTHTASGTQIVVTAGRDNGNVRLAVRDDGRGIDRGAIGRIFEPFYTADDAQGSGLGLAIASELAERMDGQLTVFSTAGQTVFTLEIPA